jgi:Yip1 domain
MDSVTLPLRAVLDPLGAVPRAVEGRRWVTAMALVSVLTALSGAAIGARLDATSVVIPKLAQSGELAKASERELSEAIEQAQRVSLVTGVAKGLLLMPLIVLVLGVVLKVAAWLIGRKALFAEALTAAALAMLPLAVLRALELVAALRASVLTPAMAESLVPSALSALREASSPGLSRVLGAVDVVNIWAALLLGLGFAAATRWAPWKGALFGLLLYVLFASAFLVGLPGLLAGVHGMGGT